MKKIGSVLALFLLLLFSGLSGMAINPILYHTENTSSIKNDELAQNGGVGLQKFSDQSPLAQDFTQNESAELNTANVTLHQAYHNDSIINIDQDSNSFTALAPNAINFNSTYSNIQINNIHTQNTTLNIETNTTSSFYKTFAESIPLSTSFTLPINCLISNISVYIQEQLGTNNSIADVNLYRSTSGGAPDLIGTHYFLGNINILAGSIGWIILNNINYYVDNSLTNNNKWYLGVVITDLNASQPAWAFSKDDAGNPDNTDSYDGFTLYNFATKTVDFLTKIGVGLNSQTAKPSDINLQINQTAVNNNQITPNHNSGFWNHTGFGSNGNNDINFTFSADWYEYSLEVNKTQINYTKSITPITSYTVQSGQDIYWESNTGYFTLFDHRLDNNTINFTIPASWDPYKLTNDTTSKGYSTFNNGSTKIVTIFGTSAATDGNWTLYCNSTNLISQIKTGIGGIETNSAYSNDTIGFNSTFVKKLTGSVNITVFNASVQGENIFTKIYTASDVDSLDLSTWNIQENITTYGDHIVRVKWNNATDVGVCDTTVFIAGAANYTMFTQNGIELLDTVTDYNITIQYFDVVKLENITGATFSCSDFEKQTYNDGKYFVTVNLTDYTPGPHSIQINLNNTNYQNYTISYDFTIVHETQIQKLNSNSTLSVVRGHNATFYLNYNQTSDETGISGAIISEVAINSTLSWSFNDLTSGNYSIPLNTSHTDVGTYECNFSIAKTDYETQNFNFNITITQAQTELILDHSTDIVQRWTGENASVWFYVNDTSNDQLVDDISSNSTLSVYNGSAPSTLWDVGLGPNNNYNLWNLGGGQYLANISTNGLDFGDYSFIINVSNTPNYNWSTLAVSFYLQGNITIIDNINLTANILDETSADNYTIYQGNDQLQIEFNFKDIDDGNRILNYEDDDQFNYYVYKDGVLFGDTFAWDIPTGTNIGNLTLSSLASRIYNFTIVVELFNYENATYSFNLTIQDLLTDISVDDVKQQGVQLGYSASSYDGLILYDVEVNCTYFDTINDNSPISGASYAIIKYNGNVYQNSSNYYGNGKYGFVIPQSVLVIGVKTVSIYFGKPEYENATITFDLSILNASTGITIDHVLQPDHNELTNTAYLSYDLIVNATYFDMNNSNSPILLADYCILILNGQPQPYPSNYENNGMYGWVIPYTDLETGLFQITIKFGKQYYNNATNTSINLTFYIVPTNVSLSEITQNHPKYEDDMLPYGSVNHNYTAFTLYDIFVNMSYLDTITSNPIDGATVSLNFNGTADYPSNYYGSGLYGLFIPFSDLVIGTYNITITLEKTYCENRTYSFNLTIYDIPTKSTFNDQYITQPDNSGLNPLVYNGTSYSYVAYEPFDIHINITYYDLNNTENIDGANSFILFNNTQFPSNYYGGGMYGFVINKSYLEAGFFNLICHFNKDNYVNANYSLNITIEVLKTGVIFYDDIYQIERNSQKLQQDVNGSYIGYIPYSIQINATFYDYVYSNPIEGANAQLEYNNHTISSNYYAASKYGWIIPQSFLVYDVQEIIIRFSEGVHSNASLAFNLTVIRIKTSYSFADLMQSDHSSSQLENDTINGYSIAYLPYDISVNISYFDEINGVPITSASFLTLIFKGKPITSNYNQNGVYGWVIPKSNMSIGIFAISIDIGLPDFDNQTINFNISIIAVPTIAEFGDITQPGHYEQTLPNNTGSGFQVFQPFNLAIYASFIDNSTDTKIGSGVEAILTYGTFVSSFDSITDGVYSWVIPTENLTLGTSSIVINFNRTGFDNVSYTITITVIGEFLLHIEIINAPEEINQGESADLTFKFTYHNGTTFQPLSNAQISLLTNVDGLGPFSNITNSEGYVVFSIVPPVDGYTNITFTVEYNGAQYGVAGGNGDFSIQTISPINPFPMWVLYIIGIFIFGFATAITIKKKVIDPRKMHYTDLLRSSATIFEDAINLEHIMIIYKRSGVCLFFKSYSEEKLDPVLISGFLTAVQTFGKELKSRQSLNEMSYGDKVLLFSDGEFIRVTLVLGQTASSYLKRNLAEFTGKFEKRYVEKLKKWSGSIDIFQDSTDLIDDVLHTSIILPHRIDPNKKVRKSISRPLSKQLLSISESFVTEDRPFVFLAQVLATAIDKTNKPPAEIILALNDLLEAKILYPIQIEQLVEIQLTDQQKRTLAERISAIPNKSDEEKEYILEQMFHLNPEEREVILSSYMQISTINAESTGEAYASQQFKDEKEVELELKRVKKQASLELKKDTFESIKKAIEHFELAELLAYQWNLENLGKKFGTSVFQTTVRLHRKIIAMGMKKGKKLAKSEDYDGAIKEYKQVFNSTEELFKMGLEVQRDLMKNVSGIIAKLGEKSQLSKGFQDYLSKEKLMKYRKNHQGEWKASLKTDDFLLQNYLTSRFYLISNMLFKYGIMNESANIKKFRQILDVIKNKYKEADQSIKDAYYAAFQIKVQQKQQLLDIADDFENKGDDLNALLTYQGLLDIYCDIADTDNATRLVAKMSEILQKMPNLEQKIQEFVQLAEQYQNEGNLEESEKYKSKATLLKSAIFFES